VWERPPWYPLASLAFHVARLLYVAVMTATLPIGYVLSHIVLGVVFYGLLTPIGLAMRAVGLDPMHRKIDRSAKSYWIARAERVTGREVLPSVLGPVRRSLR